MFILKICVEILPHKRHEFLQAVETLIDSTSKANGNISMGIYQDLKNENRFYYLAEWETRNYLNTYLKTDTFQMVMGAMNVLGEIEDAKIISPKNFEDITF